MGWISKSFHSRRYSPMIKIFMNIIDSASWPSLASPSTPPCYIWKAWSYCVRFLSFGPPWQTHSAFVLSQPYLLFYLLPITSSQPLSLLSSFLPLQRNCYWWHSWWELKACWRFHKWSSLLGCSLHKISGLIWLFVWSHFPSCIQ